MPPDIEICARIAGHCAPPPQGLRVGRGGDVTGAELTRQHRRRPEPRPRGFRPARNAGRCGRGRGLAWPFLAWPGHLRVGVHSDPRTPTPTPPASAAADAVAFTKEPRKSPSHPSIQKCHRKINKTTFRARRGPVRFVRTAFLRSPDDLKTRHGRPTKQNDKKIPGAIENWAQKLTVITRSCQPGGWLAVGRGPLDRDAGGRGPGHVLGLGGRITRVMAVLGRLPRDRDRDRGLN